MYRQHPLKALLSISVCCLSVLPGCGQASDTMVVKGRVTQNGQPLAVKNRELGLGIVRVVFYQVNDDGSVSTDPHDASADEQGNFVVYGREGQGIPPGKYKITVGQFDPYPDVDKLNGQFNLKNSKIIRQVSGEPLEIDVSRPEG